ncbi:MAG: ShlB/FhaC/HecB family hemolysin secretion/activation protein [Lyngbya sp. HA4199-MV5]|nr:ShlB/FhaC/HecB family hemolysin secretion/activation protein [Lyngbya sp. HA4199-MV5]
MPAQAIDGREKRSANGSPKPVASTTALLSDRSSHSRQTWSRCCLRLSLTLLASGFFARPLGAQTIKIAQISNPSVPGLPAPTLPPAQDVIPPTPSPTLPSAPIAPPLPPPEQLLPPATVPTTPESGVEETQDKLHVDRYEVVGSTVFTASELATITQPFTGDVSFAALVAARTALTDFYVSRGYITTGAYIPPQKLQSGVVIIQVVEGGLEDIKITGTRRLNPNYVRSRLAIAATKPLNRDRLLQALQLLQLNPLLRTISAELSAGTQPGQSLLTVSVTEAPTRSFQLNLDNGRSPSVGTFRRQLQFTEANLLGLGDALSLAYTNTAGSNAVDTSYTIPFNARNGTIALNGGFAFNRVIEAPFDALDIQSNSNYVELTVRQPLLQTPTQELAVGVTASHRETAATLLDGTIPFPALGADAQGATRLTALRFFQDYTWRGSRAVFALRSQFSVGVNALNATINPTSPDSRFFAWLGQAQYVRLLAPDTLLLLRTDVQLADRSLLALEQISEGGQDTVRGYRQDLLLADNGLFASAEVRIPLLRLPRLNGLLQLAPFVDVATVANRDSSVKLDPETIASVGLGLRLQLSDRLTARFDWGIPLISVSGDKRTLQENGLYFSVVYSQPF